MKTSPAASSAVVDHELRRATRIYSAGGRPRRCRVAYVPCQTVQRPALGGRPGTPHRQNAASREGPLYDAERPIVRQKAVRRTDDDGRRLQEVDVHAGRRRDTVPYHLARRSVRTPSPRQSHAYDASPRSADRTGLNRDEISDVTSSILHASNQMTAGPKNATRLLATCWMPRSSVAPPRSIAGTGHSKNRF